MEILKNIPISLPDDEIRRKLHIKHDSQWDEAQTLIPTARSLIAARAVYKVCYIDEKLEDALVIDGEAGFPAARKRMP